jgi:RNA polymerase sigma-70 factor (ECF subfamily)
VLENVAVADEFTQESLLQIYRKIVTFRATSAFTTWSHRVVVNVVLMELRKRKIYAPVSLDESVETLEGESTPRHIQRPDLRLEGTIDRLAIDRAIETLPPGYRLVFILHDVEGYEHCEIADMLGCSVGNSKSQLYKARLSLRRKLMERFRPTRVAV